MPLFTPEKALSQLPQTPVILSAVLDAVDAERARRATDGPDGWSIVEIVGHLNDYDEIFMRRTRQMLAQDHAALPSYDQDELVRAARYAEQNLADVLASFTSRRRAYVDLLRGLSAEQWRCVGLHSSWGEITVLDLAVYTPLHDVNHIEQVVKVLRNAS
jgi:hypothetical protein